MSAHANIVVPDAAATPVNHTFLPHSIKGDTARWNEKSATQPLGWWPLSITTRDPVGDGSVFKTTIDFSIPVVATYTSVSGAPVTVVDRVTRCQLVFLESQSGTLQERKDFRKLLVGILNDAQFVDVLENLGRPS